MSLPLFVRSLYAPFEELTTHFASEPFPVPLILDPQIIEELSPNLCMNHAIPTFTAPDRKKGMNNDQLVNRSRSTCCQHESRPSLHQSSFLVWQGEETKSYDAITGTRRNKSYFPPAYTRCVPTFTVSLCSYPVTPYWGELPWVMISLPFTTNTKRSPA